MIPATWPRDDPRTTRMLHLDPRTGDVADLKIGDLPSLLHADDLLVVNDAATLPASLSGSTESGAPVEARLAGRAGDRAWRAVLFGAGDWRTRTEDRPAPPRLGAGDVLRFDGVRASVAEVDAASPRLVTLDFSATGAELWRALYHAGRPVQYAYTAGPLAIWHTQTPFAARPWASEAPSAGFALTWELLLELRRRGVGVASVTHAAGLSSTGDDVLDARLPLSERYDMTDGAVRAVEGCRARRARIVAVGTTVVRALEGAAANNGGRLVAGSGTTDIVLGPGSTRLVVDAIVTGVHEPSTSHFRLLESFAAREDLDRAHAFAESRGYRGHEFGDAMLLL